MSKIGVQVPLVLTSSPPSTDGDSNSQKLGGCWCLVDAAR